MPPSQLVGTATRTRYFDADGTEVFPCRCGETHTGDYAAHDWAHHNCLHEATLEPVEPDVGYYMCPECGATFWLRDVMEKSEEEGRLE